MNFTQLNFYCKFYIKLFIIELRVCKKESEQENLKKIVGSFFFLNVGNWIRMWVVFLIKIKLNYINKRLKLEENIKSYKLKAQKLLEIAFQKKL